ncbi:MAG TPA: hypothetical protein PLV92_28665, partial [Pirellulaceae bacterium]|nr:hypothetical protein [Pirellulaceae bacterium]
MKRFRWRRAILLLAVTIVGLSVALLWRAHTGFARGKQLLSFELWPDARVELGRYLWLHPSDANARVMIAEALIKDDTLPADVAIGSALHHLQTVPDDSDYAAKARCQEGRIELFLLNRPARAERLFRHAIDVNSKAIDPHFMIWKLYDLTGRSHLAEAEFWRVYEISSPLERGLRLREWYMSQFYPATANPTLDRMMGVSDRDANAAKTEGQRFIRFRDSEPDGAAGYAALARWFQHEGDSQFALQVL